MSMFGNNPRGVWQAGVLLCSAAALLNADTLTLRNGATVQGTYLGGTAREVRMDQNGSIRTYDIGQVQSVIFSEPAQSAPPPPPPPSYPQPRAERRDRDDRDYNRGPQSAGLTIPIDTA